MWHTKNMYRTGSHTKYRLMYHLVWIPKYRKRVLRGKVAERLKELFYQCAEVNDWKIEELNIQLDHVHMMIQLKTTVSIAKAVQLLKGGSSKKIREEFPELEEFLWGDSFWSEGYFAETVGQINEAAIRRYIQNQ
jgi:putative transposase